MSNKPVTLFDKVWDAHVVRKIEDGPDVLLSTGILFMKLQAP